MGTVSNAVDVIEARKAAIGDGAEVRRLLPQRTLRTIGAWCFLDHYGPDEVSRGPGMQVPPHPHIGLQTVSWLFQGLVLHRDSLGRRQLIRPGELNLMTAGRGITHSEDSAAGRPRARGLGGRLLPGGPRLPRPLLWPRPNCLPCPSGRGNQEAGPGLSAARRPPR